MPFGAVPCHKGRNDEGESDDYGQWHEFRCIGGSGGDNDSDHCENGGVAPSGWDRSRGLHCGPVRRHGAEQVPTQ